MIFYQNPKDTALSIGKHAPIPNQTATINPKIKIKLAIGRRNGFWNLFTFSINGTVTNPSGTEAIANTPNNLFGNTRNTTINTIIIPNDESIEVDENRSGGTSIINILQKNSANLVEKLIINHDD